MKRFTLLVTFGMVIALLVAACGGGGDPTSTPAPTATPQPTATPVPGEATATPQPTSTPQPTATPAPIPTAIPTATPPPDVKFVRGGVLIHAIPDSTATASFQPSIRNPEWGDAHAVASYPFYQTIMQNDPFDSHTLKGLLVDQWEYNAAATEITFRTSPDAMWSDGTPFTAQDIAFNLDVWKNPGDEFTVNSSARVIARTTDSWDVLDDRTIRLNLTGPDVSLLSFFAVVTVIALPAHRTLEESAKEPVGTGPFELIDITTDVKFTYINNPRYQVKGPDGEQLPYLNSIEGIIFQDASRVFAGILTGQLDLAHAVWGSAVRGKRDEIARRLPNAINMTRFASSGGWGFSNKAPFNDPKVMKAFNIATDRIARIELARSGRGVLDGMGVLAASAGGQWSIPTEEVLSAPGYRHVNKNTGELELDQVKLIENLSLLYEKDPADIELAKSLLREAGLDPDSGDFPKLTIMADARLTEVDTVVNAQTLKESLGIDVIVDSKDPGSAAELRLSGNFQAVQFFAFSPGFDPSRSLSFFTTDLHFWTHGFEVPEFDALFERQRQAVDPAERKTIIFEMQRMILDGMHVIPISVFHDSSGIAREWVINLPIPALSSTTVYLWDRIWIDERLR